VIIKSLKQFQTDAIDSGVKLFAYAKELLDTARDDSESRELAVNHNGYLLVEAPTGAGKTLIAGAMAERFAGIDDLVWFWFAPFKGVVGQTESFLREQFSGLRLRDLRDDRTLVNSKRGDVFVTTWGLVAARNKEARRVRNDGELNPSVDTLIYGLRAMGLRIGVVVDEAHHGFGRETQAGLFFREVLRPEYTVLITATPDDTEIKQFERDMNVAELHRTTISRVDAVEAGLIKEGIKCVAYLAEEEKKTLVDFEAIALTDAAAVHQRIKSELETAGVSLAPLMLVQVNSEEKSIERARTRLLSLGFTDEQIAVHTADEPDSGLLALANDERREVLIFKMAVALGFDAPRAFTLVSMRASREPDFGVQLVGRILRVHRRLQGRKMPELLEYGYVFLADAEMQTGIDTAGQRINQLRTEYAKLSPSTAIVRVGGGSMVQVIDVGGQTKFFQEPARQTGINRINDDFSAPATTHQGSFALDCLIGPRHGMIEGDDRPFPVPLPSKRLHTYPLKTSAPHRFKTQVLPVDFDEVEEECAARFAISANELIKAIAGKVRVQKKTLDVFTQQLELELTSATFSAAEVALQAQRILCRSEIFHAKELRRQLLARLAKEFESHGIEDYADNPARLTHALNLILVQRPKLLTEAQKAALGEHTIVQEAEAIPTELKEEVPLSGSLHNVYGVMPRGMNSWERKFGELLDRDLDGLVLWWHRNERQKPWSVRVILPDGRGFFPDFIVGVGGRKKEDGVLLAETKEAFERGSEEPKVLAEHKTYGRILIVHLRGGIEWMTVRYDEQRQRAVLDRVFQLPQMVVY
jgi:superfamily II DNA or RNA helicase